MSEPSPPPLWESDFDTEPLHTSVWDVEDLLHDSSVGGGFEWPPTEAARPGRWKVPVIAAAGLAGAVASIVGLVHLFSGPAPAADEVRVTASSAATSTSPTLTMPSHDPVARGRLMALLPPGSNGQTCHDTTAPRGAVAAVECGPNADAADTTSRFTLFDSAADLKSGLDGVITQLTVQQCPGPNGQSYQSPGAWRRNAAPDVEAGILVCGVQQGRPTVAWTSQADRLLAVIAADPMGPPLTRLYSWWTAHS